ncbi:MAG: AgmX/PglI C-terminal domain-containing protein [Myxococcota bacterium]
MAVAEKTSNSLLIWALGFSLLVHIAMVISVMNIKIPEQRSSREDFEQWVKQIAPPKREAILLPEAPLPVTKSTTGPKSDVGSATGSGEPAAAASEKQATRDSGGGGASESGSGSGSPNAAKAARTKALRSSGVLGVIGVASSGGGGSALADVFSSNSGKVSDNLNGVMEGKQRVELPNSSNISRQALKGPGGGGPGGKGPADIGGIASESSAKVNAGSRQGSDIPMPRVSSSAGTLVAGSVDANSVISVISRKNSSFTRCYERALRTNPDLAGRIAYEISVGEEGSVLDVKFTEDTLRARDVLDCIKGILMRLQFPQPKGGPAIFSSVLVFGTT